jgi:hypothetical protein
MYSMFGGMCMIKGAGTAPLGDGEQFLGSEGALGVHVDHPALGPAQLQGPLGGHAQGVAQLRLACAELPEDFGQRAWRWCRVIHDNDIL